MVRGYDHPNSLVTRYAGGRGEPGGGSGTSVPFLLPHKSRLRAVHGRVAAAGTSVADNTWPIRNGTASIGELVAGTTAIGGIVTATFNLVLVDGSLLNCLRGSDNAGLLDIVYEYEVMPDAVLSSESG